MEKVQWSSIDKKQNGLKYSKYDKSSTLSGGKKSKAGKYNEILLAENKMDLKNVIHTPTLVYLILPMVQLK